MRTVCGIDLGTQSCKILLYDAESRKVMARSQAPLALSARDDGAREQDAAWYADAVSACFGAIAPGLKETIVAIGVSGQQHGFVPLGEAGQPLYPVKLWCDTSTAAECVELTEAAGGEAALLAETGMPMLPGYTAPKILWLKKRRPELFARLARVLLPHDYVNFLLTGDYSTDYGDASGTALFDIRRRRWSAKVCALIDSGLEGLLPPTRGPAEPAGEVRAAAAAAFGIPEGIIVSSGGGDNMMGAIGTGTVRDGFLTMSLGTSGTLYGYSDAPVVDPAGRLAAFCSSTGGWLPLLCTMNCTVASERVRSLLGCDLAGLNALAGAAPVGAEGLIMLPFFNGERVPNLPGGRASVNGATSANFTRENLARAAMESAIFGMRIGLDAFRSLGFLAREIRLIGGGAKSPLWRAMVADITGLPVRLPLGEEAAALGAALQALYCAETVAGKAPRLIDIVGAHVMMDGGVIEPDPARAARCADAYGEYLSYLEALRPLYR